jgi:predicted DNA binding CopG/RHH family protein
VGEAALIIHGMPRATLDIDICVRARTGCLIQLFKIADSLGLHSDQKSILAMKDSPKLFENQWACFSFQKQDVMDVFFTDDKTFSKLFRNSELKKDKSLAIRVASLKDIAAMKKSSRRAVDLSDVAYIEEIKRLQKTRT